RRTGGAPPYRAASPPALFLLALSPGQRTLSVHRPARAGIGLRTGRYAPGQAGEAQVLAGPRRPAGRGCGIPRRSHVIAGFGAPPSAEPRPAAQEGADSGGADPSARESGAPRAGGDGFRGRALDRPDLARAARSHRRAGSQPAGAADRDVPPRIPAALGRPAASDNAGAQSLGPA